MKTTTKTTTTAAVAAKYIQKRLKKTKPNRFLEAKPNPKSRNLIVDRTPAKEPNKKGKRAGEALASHAGVFRGVRFSSLPTNACSTEDNIPFPSLANHTVLSKFWKVDLDRKVI